MSKEAVYEKCKILSELGIHLTKADKHKLATAQNDTQLDNMARVYINRKFDDF